MTDAEGTGPAPVHLNKPMSDLERQETRMRAALVREIRDARCWQDMVEANDALFQVRLRAKAMKREAEMFDESAKEQAQGALARQNV